MSYSTLYSVPESGQIENYKEYRNGWGTAPVIWDHIIDKYKLKGEHEYSLMPSVMKKLFDMINETHEKILPWERVCLALTCDRMILKRENFFKASDALEKFHTATHSPERVNHLLQISKDLIELAKDDSVYGACFIWTSVSDDVWDSPNREDEDECSMQWDISKDKGHWFLFQEYGSIF